MAMEHKAFVFDYDGFTGELSKALLAALQSGDVRGLREFITANLESLKDPYEGEPLDDDWESLVNPKDAHQYGDFALTKFYDPTADIGLAHRWEGLEQLLDTELGSGSGTAILLGKPFGPSKNPFDPGKMGAYFQSPGDVRENLRRLRELTLRKPELGEKLGAWIDVLDRASEEARGLYVTF
jgi:hypothetical protein